MTTTTTAPQTQAPHRKGGYSELVMVGLLLVLSAILIYGSVTMNALDDATPGPRTVPLLIGIGLIVIAIFLAIDVIRNPETDHDTVTVLPYDMSADMLHDLAGLSSMEDTILHHRGARPVAETAEGTGAPQASAEGSARKLKVDTDWPTLLAVLASTIGFVVVLPYAGWIISAAALFWLVAHFLGSTRPVFDIWVSLIVAATVQLIFGGLLGLNLPAGFLGGF